MVLFHQLPKDIRANLNTAKYFMILSAVIVGGFALAFTYFVITTNQNKQLNKILIDKEGTIYKGVDFLSDQEFYNINARAHLILFVKFFYQFSKENINYNMNHARLLGDNTIDIIYQNNNQNNCSFYYVCYHC